MTGPNLHLDSTIGCFFVGMVLAIVCVIWLCLFCSADNALLQSVWLYVRASIVLLLAVSGRSNQLQVFCESLDNLSGVYADSVFTIRRYCYYGWLYAP